MPKAVQKNYHRVMSIAHGKSELVLCQSIRSNLRVSQEIVAKKSGRNSIQITSLINTLNDGRFMSFSKFIAEYGEKVQHDRKQLIDFKLYPIMDTDDCTEQQKRDYINGNMFRGHWLEQYIVPVFNSPNLEAVMEKIGVPVEHKSDYIRLFPTNHGGDLDLNKMKELYERLARCDATNMDSYVLRCIEIAERKLRG